MYYQVSRNQAHIFQGSIPHGRWLSRYGKPSRTTTECNCFISGSRWKDLATTRKKDHAADCDTWGSLLSRIESISTIESARSTNCPIDVQAVEGRRRA